MGSTLNLAQVAGLSQQGDEYTGNSNDASYITQNVTLTRRMFVNNLRNIGVFWLRLGM